MSEQSKSKSEQGSFFHNETNICPICEAEFHIEQIRTGRGRLNAGDLTEELHRHYNPSAQFGRAYPLLYVYMTCPSCYYSATPADFDSINPEVKSALSNQTDERKKQLTDLLGSLPDLTESRNLLGGIAAALATSICYHLRPAEIAPTIQRGIATLRAAWLCLDYHSQVDSTQNFDALAFMLEQEAASLYRSALAKDTSNAESLLAPSTLGPDQDQNYGYDGVVYLSTLLTFKYGAREPVEERYHQLETCRVAIAKVVGLGKASRNKPAAILNTGRATYEKIFAELKELKPFVKDAKTY